MFSASIIEKYGLKNQHQLSPDGYPIFIAESLSNNHPTVFFELVHVRNETTELPNEEDQVRITKAGAVDHILLPMSVLGELNFTEVQQLIEEKLRIPG